MIGVQKKSACGLPDTLFELAMRELYARTSYLDDENGIELLPTPFPHCCSNATIIQYKIVLNSIFQDQLGISRL